MSKPIAQVYSERNNLAVALAKVILARGGRAGTNTDQSGNTVLYIDVPGAGQVSYHLFGDDVHLSHGLPAYAGEWDRKFTGREPYWSARVSA